MVKFTNEIAKRCARWILLETSPAPLPMLHPVRDDMAAAADEIDRLQKLIPNEPQEAPNRENLRPFAEWADRNRSAVSHEAADELILLARKACDAYGPLSRPERGGE